MSKALKESKVNTSWVNPNQAYDEAVHVYIEAVLNRTVPNPFLEDFGPFQEWVAECGIWNSLAQVLIKITAPGVPDFYQGTEMWDFSLVDPDNRRPVDYALRATLAAELQHICSIPGADRLSLVRDLIKARADGRIKLYVTMTALAYRRAHPELFLDGEYVPLETRGRQMDRVCAFTRIYRDQAVVTVVPRLVSALVQERTGVPVGRPVWADTFLTVPSWSPTSQYYNLLTGELLTAKKDGEQQVLPLAEVFGESPIALLERRT
jgi:(1->4)-alpha-D-glucan 1-alpha-D-glucosylmutase